MKRNKKSFPIIKKIRPIIFWYECKFCRREFKLETGFKIIDKKVCYSTGTNPFINTYCCNECAKNENEVKELISKSKEILSSSRPGYLK